MEYRNPQTWNTLNQVWFYFEFISKSITEAMIVHETKQPITERCSEYICTLVGLITTEICNRFFNEFERVCRFNSSLAFFIRDLIGVLPRARVLNFIKIYSDLTSEAIRGNIGKDLQHGLTDKMRYKTFETWLNKTLLVPTLSGGFNTGIGCGYNNNHSNSARCDLCAYGFRTPITPKKRGANDRYNPNHSKL